jgi:hypothetical protein
MTYLCFTLQIGPCFNSRLNPASLLSSIDELQKEKHNCFQITNIFFLLKTTIENIEVILFIDDSYIQEKQRHF